VEAKSGELISGDQFARRPIRLLLDGRKLRDGGIGVYTDNLITGFLEVGGVAITVLYSDARCRKVPYASKVEWLWDGARPYSLDEMLRMPSRIDFSRYDIFHTPHYMLPYRIPIPTVVTVHDLIHITHPEKLWYPSVAKFLIRSAVRRADGVLAVSRHTRSAVSSLTGAADAKVRYVPNAISPRILAPFAEAPHNDDALPYLLALFSNTKPHKGLRDLLEAYQAFREGRQWASHSKVCPNLHLAGFGAQELLDSSSDRAALERIEGVRIVGALSDARLRAELRGALALVVPSQVEGFCLPAVEAQAVGTPVVCRPVPALLELVTERDTVAQSFSIASLTKAIEEGLETARRSERAPLRAHLDLYSCANVASMVRSEYERILTARSRS
jgi:glycosyltransferase involved in cell wall biosynthesis